MVDWNKYVGLPFGDCGRGPRYDCYGIVWLLHREVLGIEIPSFDDQYFSARDAHLPALILKECKKWEPVEQPRMGDVVVININNQPRHVGFVTHPDVGAMIHTLYGCKSIHEQWTRMIWRNRIAGFYRFNPDHR